MKPAPLRLFHLVVGPRAGTVIIGLALITFALYLAWVDPADLEQTVGMALFLQLFAASTGYRDPLRRGHFDPLLVGGSNPWTTLLAHWLVSTGPGLVVWIVLGLIDLVARHGQPAAPFTLAGISVVLYASTVAWTVTLSLPRYSGAVLWLGVLFALGTTQQLQALRVAFSPAPDAWIGVFRSTAAAMVFPVFLLLDPTALSLRLAALMLVATFVAWTAGVLAIARFEAALVQS